MRFPNVRQSHAVLAVLVAGAVGVSVLSYGVLQQGQAINSQGAEIAHQQGQLAALVRQLCDTLSASRVDANRELRTPLRAALAREVQLLRELAEVARPDARRRLRRAAAAAKRQASRITLSGPIDCSLGTALAGAPAPTPTPLPAGLIVAPGHGGNPVEIDVPAGSTFVPSQAPTPGPTRAPPTPARSCPRRPRPGARCWCARHPRSPRCAPTS